MCDLEIHRRFTVRFAGVAADQQRGELGQSERGGELVEIALVVAVEGEDHDGDPLAGVAVRRQSAGVVGV